MSALSLPALAVGFLFLLFMVGWTGILLLCFPSFRRNSRRKRLAFRLLALGLPVILLASAREVPLRYIVDRSEGMGLKATNRAWYRRHVNPYLNSDGFREREYPRDEGRARHAPHPYRVVVVGDSNTFGKGINELSDRLGERLQALLRPHIAGAEVWTLAKSGWSTREEIEALRRYGPRLRPRVVVLAHHKNDLEDHVSMKRGLKAPPPGLAWVVRVSYAASDLYWSLETAVRPELQEYRKRKIAAYDDPEVWGRHTEDLREFLRLTRELGATPVFLAVPSSGALPAEPLADVGAFNAFWRSEYTERSRNLRLAEFAAEEGVAIADPLEAFALVGHSGIIVSRHDTHPNERGHALMAEALLPHVLEILGE